MLSNTADTKPRPNAVCHDASGSFSTGIIDAASTSDSRKTLPLNAPGQLAPRGRADGGAEQQHHPHCGADEGKAAGNRREANVGNDVDDDRRNQHERDNRTLTQSMTMLAGASRVIGE